MNSSLFTIIISENVRNFLYKIFFKKFLDHPLGEEFDRIMILVFNSLQIKAQYKFAWKAKTTTSLFLINIFNKIIKETIYLICLPQLSQKSKYGL